jgi:large subunit ribosomal protein L1
MSGLSKRAKAIAEKVDSAKVYALTEALDLLKDLSSVKFSETVEVSVNLGVDPKKSDQVVRGATVLPNGTGKSVRVAVFTQGANVEIAEKAGADIVGFEDLAASVKSGDIDFDVVIASPDAMRIVGQLGQILGPKGLMPNPKVGTVTPDVGKAVQNAKAGQVRYRADRAGIVHAPVGKVDFSTENLVGNIQNLLAALQKSKPSTSKGIYLQKLTLSTTMGPGLTIDLSSID